MYTRLENGDERGGTPLNPVVDVDNFTEEVRPLLFHFSVLI